MMKYLPYLFLNLSTRRTNSGVIGLYGGKFTVNFFFLMAGIAVKEKSFSVAKKNYRDPEKISKGWFGPDDNTFDGDEAEGWKPKSNQTDLMNNRNRNHGTSH
ncbi:hypothetical protein ACS6JN_05915 [Enterobacter hormaechei subsp. steigerwaltii]|uniref:hypothetical protein n=1 Tax=Enterobacter hormaechei TaxID=158836 RepID=UPI003F435330